MMGWLLPPELLVMADPVGCGTHSITLTSLSLPEAPDGAVRAVKIAAAHSSSSVYIISLRTERGYDSGLGREAPAFIDRVQVHHISTWIAHHSSLVAALPVGVERMIGEWNIKVLNIANNVASIVLAFCGVPVDLPPMQPPPKQTCSQLGWAVQDPSPVSTCGQSTILETCHRNVSHGAGAQVCAGVGARLCTSTEVELNVVQGTGCLLDEEYIWTSTPCEVQSDPVSDHGFVIKMGRHIEARETAHAAAFPAVCGVDDALASVRCCANEPTEAPTSVPTSGPTSPPTNPPTEPPTAPPCDNVISDTLCDGWASRGLCNHPHVQEYLEVNCKGSCDFPCPLLPPEQGPTYSEAAPEESCEESALADVNTRSACEAAARQLGLEIFDVAARINSSEMPRGCYVREGTGPSSRRLWFNVYDGPEDVTDREDRVSLCLE